MELLLGIPVFGSLLATIIPFLVVLGVVVFVHEYGHYIVGRWCGIDAEVFSVGYGRPLYKWRDKRGTVWQIAALPLGGYVKFAGDGNAASFPSNADTGGMDEAERRRTFPGASVWRRALTVAAGPVFNFILSTVVFAGLLMWNGQPIETPTVGKVLVPQAAPQDLQVGDEIVGVNGAPVADFAELLEAVTGLPEGFDDDIALTVRRDGTEREILAPFLYPPLVQRVVPLSPASEAGLLPGDLIIRIGEQEPRSFEALRQVVLASEGVTLDMVVLRDGEEITLQIAPEITDTPKEGGGFERRVMIGVVGTMAFERESQVPRIDRALWGGMVGVQNVIITSLDGLRHIVRGALGADDGLSADQIQGPIGIAQISGASARQGWVDFIQLIALLSTAIGMLNLFPIPILDGGHLVIFGYEAIFGRQPPEKVLNFAMSVGFVLLMALMLFATYNDLARL